MEAQPLYDFAPLAQMLFLAALIGFGPLVWLWRCHRGSTPVVRLRALSLLALFLTFDLIVVGAFTRLTDSGLGCPDWPGCYGSATPLGASQAIAAAQSALPSGPVTHGKAWIEMVHRYLAAGVGVLITVLTIASWVQARRHPTAVSPWWPSLTLAWVCLQGAFGAWTVTMKLYPAVVTVHLLLGIGLLSLLAAQSQAYERKPLLLPNGLHVGVVAVFALCVIQVALGGWVSTNYAVLHGFTVFRELGAGKDGGYLPFAALTAIHMVHRIGAAVVFTAMALLVWRLHADGSAPTRRWAWAITAVAGWQFASGLSNVVLGWPLVAAVAHTAGAAMLIALLTVLLVRSSQARRHPQASRSPALQQSLAASR